MLESRLVPLQKRLPTQILAPQGAKRQVLKMCQKMRQKRGVVAIYLFVSNKYFAGSHEWMCERVQEMYNQTKDESSAFRDIESNLKNRRL
jgi:hypothetical protein